MTNLSLNRLGDAISKFGEKRHISHLSYNHSMCLENVTVFFSPCMESDGMGIIAILSMLYIPTRIVKT